MLMLPAALLGDKHTACLPGSYTTLFNLISKPNREIFKWGNTLCWLFFFFLQKENLEITALSLSKTAPTEPRNRARFLLDRSNTQLTQLKCYAPPFTYKAQHNGSYTHRESNKATSLFIRIQLVPLNRLLF